MKDLVTKINEIFKEHKNGKRVNLPTELIPTKKSIYIGDVFKDLIVECKKHITFKKNTNDILDNIVKEFKEAEVDISVMKKELTKNNWLMFKKKDEYIVMYFSTN